MTRVRFIKPSAEYRQSHDSLVAEFIEAGEERVPWVLDEVGDDFESYIAWLDRSARGIDLADGFVPNSTFWLMDDMDSIVAVANLRHALTDELLRFGGHVGFGVRPSARRKGYATRVLKECIHEARLLGINRMRVTCDKDNVASSRTIIRNGGLLDEEEYMQEHGRVIQRYWINV